jgi:hypothetical protein
VQRLLLPLLPPLLLNAPALKQSQQLDVAHADLLRSPLPAAL